MTDILDLIDNATEHRCACGCAVQLDSDGPSAWFASQDCQRRWNESHATDPNDVYRRPDGGDGWAWDAMVSNGSSANHSAALDFMASTVDSEAIRGRSGIVTAAENARVWIGEQEVTDMVVPGSIRVHYDTTPLVDASPWSTAPPGLSAGAFARIFMDATTPGTHVDDAALERIQGLQDVSGTITGYLEPALWAMALNGNAYIVDETRGWAAARRLRLRKVHSDYSRRLRARRKRR